MRGGMRSCSIGMYEPPPRECDAANHSPTLWDLGPMGLPSSAEGVLAGQSDASLLPAALPVALGAAMLPALPRSPWPLILLPADSSTFPATVPRVAAATVGWHEAVSGPGVGVSPGLSPLRPLCSSPWGEHPA